MAQVVGVEFRRRHQCSICGKIEPWSDEWQWFGSELDVDDGLSFVKTCSEACRSGMTEPDLEKLHRRLQRESKRRGERVYFIPPAPTEATRP